MSQKNYEKLIKKTNDMLAEIDNMKVSEIKQTSENGKRYVSAKLVEGAKNG